MLATFAGDTSHTGSSDSRTFDIYRASSVTTLTCSEEQDWIGVTYDGSAQTPCKATVTGAGGLNDQSLVPRYTNNLNAGTATAYASFDGGTNHEGSSDGRNVSVHPK